jgi:hypothetical protein
VMDCCDEACFKIAYDILIIGMSLTSFLSAMLVRSRSTSCSLAGFCARHAGNHLLDEYLSLTCCWIPLCACGAACCRLAA